MSRHHINRTLSLCGLLLFALISVTTSDETNDGFCKSKDDVDCVDNDGIENYEQIDESLNSLDQDDPVLIEMIKIRLINPPKNPVPYRLNEDFRNVNKPAGGQYNQVNTVDRPYMTLCQCNLATYKCKINNFKKLCPLVIAKNLTSIILQ
jgi:hypothetical protein